MNTTPTNELSNRPQLLLISIVCFAALAYAFHLQHSQDLNACLMCIIARYIILTTGTLSLIAFGLTFIKNKYSHWIAKALHLITYPIVFAGIYFVYKHYTIIQAQSDVCSINPLQITLNSWPTVNLWQDFFEVRGSCAAVQTMLHGIPIHFTPLIVYVLFFFFSFAYFRYDNYMLDKKFEQNEH